MQVLREGIEGQPGEVTSYHGQGTFEEASERICDMLSSFEGSVYACMFVCVCVSCG